MKVATQKTVIISDSGPKRASFMNWLATAVNHDVRHVHFYKFGDTEGKVVKYIDFEYAHELQRFIAVDANMLSEPLLIPLLSGAKKIVFFVTQQNDVDDSWVQKLFVNHRLLLRKSPKVFILFSQGGREHALVLESKLKTLGISPIYPDLHANDFRAVWETIIGEDAPDLKNVTNKAVNVEGKVLANVASTASAVAKLASKPVTQQVHQANSQHESVAGAKKKSIETKELEISLSKDNTSESPPTTNLGDFKMANINDTLATLMAIDGAMGCFIADYTSGMVLAKAGSGVNLDIAAAGNTEVIKAKMKTMVALGIRESIEDILITLGTQYHIIRPMATKQGLFLYIVLDKAKSNLAMARFKLLDAEKALTV